MCIRDRLEADNPGFDEYRRELGPIGHDPAELLAFVSVFGELSEEEMCIRDRESIVLRELLDKKLWEIPERIKDKAAFEENINITLRQYHPDYWRARQAGIERAAHRAAPAPSRSPEH